MTTTLPVFRRMIANRYGLLTALLIGVGGVLAAPSQAALAATIVVNTATDENTSNVDCSLREAITAANTDAANNGCTTGSGADVIEFQITGSGVRTITPLLALGGLPAITTPVTIDGCSQGVNDATRATTARR